LFVLSALADGEARVAEIKSAAHQAALAHEAHVKSHLNHFDLYATTWSVG